ncbi:MAG: prephenate dehydratase [Nitrososphaerales archaeon]|nr:prephenate dehydratase [Nitrososphaerales archaeon]
MTDSSFSKIEKVVAFQGEIGAYSEEAAFLFFGPSVEAKPHRSLPEVFKAVEEGWADFGIVPVENSLEGSVNQTYDLLLSSELKVSGEVVLRVTHCLIANRKMSLKSIKTVYSHPQALAQCRNFLDGLKCELVPTYDTAGSVKLIKEGGLLDSCAIASERAAKIYNMEILAKGIEDDKNNYTRFFVLSERDSMYTGKDKTSVIFSTKNVPGALYSALKEFATRRINLTKIESRPTKAMPWEYNFYLDFEGHRDEERCKKALEGLEKKALFVKILGSYPRWQ